MKISAKGKYALSSMLYLAEVSSAKKKVNLTTLARDLSISKIYLEQVFSSLKKEGLVISEKGAGGGYALSKRPKEIKAFDILNIFELSLFEETRGFLKDENRKIEEVITENIFTPLDEKIKAFLLKLTLKDLVDLLREKREGEDPMYYL